MTKNQPVVSYCNIEALFPRIFPFNLLSDLQLLLPQIKRYTYHSVFTPKTLKMIDLDPKVS